MFSRISLMIWLLLRSVPPLTAKRLVMPMTFLSAWTLMRFLGSGEAVAFVWAAVFAQVAQIWYVLPMTVARQKEVTDRVKVAMSRGLAVLLILLCAQVWLCDPLFTQRLLSAYCVIYVAIMILGQMGARIILDRYTPSVSCGARVPMVMRYHMLRLYAFAALFVLIVNEALIAKAVSMTTTVVTLAILPLVLHVLFEIAAVLTMPLSDDADQEA